MPAAPQPPPDIPVAPSRARVYGTHFGYSVFGFTIRHLGVLPAYALLWVVVPSYLILRPQIRRSLIPYLSRRFPGDSPLRRFFRTATHLNAFARVLVDQAAMMILGVDRVSIVSPNREALRTAAARGRGMVILSSHIGNWQSAMRVVGKVDRRVHVQIDRRYRDAGQYIFNLAGESDKFRVIAPDAFLGGAVEMIQALREGDIVAVMGDRVEGARAGTAHLLGDPVALPLMPYQLAIQGDADLVVVLAARTGRMAFHVDLEVITDGLDLATLDRREAMNTLLRRYVALVENHLKAHPHMWFNFFDLWATPTEATEGESAGGSEGRAERGDHSRAEDRGRGPRPGH
jgi:predicted LPLAT superfamily acyltransferase